MLRARIYLDFGLKVRALERFTQDGLGVRLPFVVVRRNTERDEWIKYLTLYSVSIEDRVQ